MYYVRKRGNQGIPYFEIWIDNCLPLGQTVVKEGEIETLDGNIRLTDIWGLE